MIQIDLSRHGYWLEKTKQPNLILLASIFGNPDAMKEYMDTEMATDVICGGQRPGAPR